MIDIAPRLRDAGMSEAESGAKARLLECCGEALNAARRSAGERQAFFVPGRIEVLGKHTDYAGGRSLLCTMERGFVLLVAPRADSLVCVTDAMRGERHELDLDPGLDTARGDWSAYAATVIRRVARNFPDARRGADIAFASDLPAASGMSSSSALVIAIFAALDSVNDLAGRAAYRRAISSPETLAAYLSAVESGASFGGLTGDDDGGLGILGGSEDHTAILCCRAGFLSRYAFCPVRPEGEIPFPQGRAFVIAYSGIAAEKSRGARTSYNEASLAVRRILAVWNDATARRDASLADAIGSADGASDRMRAILRASRPPDFTPHRLCDRFDQFVAESCDLIPRVAGAFARGDLAEIGMLVDRSQAGAEALLGNQVPETIALARMARANGADAASAFGAGFGGSVWAMTAAADAGEFAETWRDRYREAFPAAAASALFFVTRPGPAMTPCGGA